MATRRSSLWPIVSAVIGVALLVIALPTEWKRWAPPFLNPSFHLGLDLAGGTQLDFRISEDELLSQRARIESDINALEQTGGGERLLILQEQLRVIDEQRTNLVEAIRTVLERRINALGVSEATITPSYVGDEKHLLVECPGVVDTQTCIETVGKTIQLEFKEEQSEATPEYEQGVRSRVAATLASLRSGSGTLKSVGEDLGDELGMAFNDQRLYFRDQLPPGLESAWDTPASRGVFQMEGTVKTQDLDEAGNPTERDVKGIFLAEVLGPRTQTGRVLNEASVAFAHLAATQPNLASQTRKDVVLNDTVSPRLIGALRGIQQGTLTAVALDDNTANVLFLRIFTPGKEQVDVSHILVGYKGAQSAEASVTRTKEQAAARAAELQQQLGGGASFDELARTQSDALTRQNGGKLGAIGRGQLVSNFEAAVFGGKTADILGPIETPFGFHIARVDRERYTTPDMASFDELVITGPDSATRADTFKADLEAGRVKRNEDAVALRVLFFSSEPTGWKDTALDGKHFRSATVTLDPTTNIPVVQIAFDDEGATIFQELTKRNIGKQIAIFVGGQLVTAPRVDSEITGGTAVITGSSNIQEAQALAQDLNTGAIPAPIHLSGQRTVEPTLGAEALSTSMQAGLVGIIIVMLYMILLYRAFGVIASLALTTYAIIFLALFKLPLFLFTNQYMVLTLAGAAGLILSIGMAVDTNVLVFERVKEELRRGKGLRTAIDIGFEKAWPSVRDSNISTLITCALLFLIGTSIVRGFALTLGIGVLISMLTGLVISREIARWVAGTPLAQNPALFPGMAKETPAA